MTVFAAEAAREELGGGVPAKPPKTPNGFGPLVPALVLEPEPPLEPLPVVEEEGSVEILPRPPRPKLTTPADNCAPRSRLKFRCAMTMRGSISTCGSGWSRIA